MKIAIAGPGRSGTSLLVNLLREWGFLALDTPMVEDANAGLESRIGKEDGLEIHKDPWFYEYIHEITPEILHSYNAFLIPIRDLKSTAVSRMTQERLSRATQFDNNEWAFSTWSSTGGGAVYQTTVQEVERVSEVGLWKVIERLAEVGIQPIFLHFPRFATDFDYLWEQIGHLAKERITKQAALDVFNRVVEPNKIRINVELQTSDLDTAELQALVTELKNKTRTLLQENSELSQEVDRLRWTLQDIKQSLVWRLTNFIRTTR